MPRVKTRTRRPAPVTDALAGLGDRIRKARIETGLSQAQLGAPNFTRAHLSAIELGKVRPAMKTLEFIAAKLGKPASFFIQDEGEELRRKEREAILTRASQLVSEGRPQEAIDLLTPLLAEVPAGRDKASIQRVVGRAYWEAGSGAQSAAALGDALRFFQSTADPEQVARTRAQLGQALHLLMNYGEAAEQFEEALRAIVRGEVKDPLFKVHVLHNLGLTFFQRGEYSVAVEHFDRAEREGSDIGDPKWLASLFAAIGMSRYAMDDYEAAVTYLHKSQGLFELIRNQSRATEIRFQTGRALWAMGNKTKGLEVLEDALRLARALKNPVLAARIEINLATYESQEGRYDHAVSRLARLKAEVDAFDDVGIKHLVRFGLALVHKARDPKRAERELKEAAALLEGTKGAHPELSEVYAELSDVLAKRGLAEEALEYSRRALKLARKK